MVNEWDIVRVVNNAINFGYNHLKMR
jgi:hypothetical protein